jgi:hypothetical protein
VAADTATQVPTIDNTTATINPIKAPFPHDFAFLGLELFQTRNKINPTNGKKKLNTAKPPLGASFGFIMPTTGGFGLPAEQPHLTHTTASSLISAPQ